MVSTLMLLLALQSAPVLENDFVRVFLGYSTVADGLRRRLALGAIRNHSFVVNVNDMMVGSMARNFGV